MPQLAAGHERARDCLAAAAWYEAGDDPSGERAVVQVVLNRARHPAFAASVCGVVFQGSERVTGCQFTFTCDGSLAARHPGPAAWARARAIAGRPCRRSRSARGLGHALPCRLCRAQMAEFADKLAQVGAHLFYRWQGWWGTAPAFRSPSPVGPAQTAANRSKRR
jgi:spore germination cell wall hydrolase CwlJ-like protein